MGSYITLGLSLARCVFGKVFLRNNRQQLVGLCSSPCSWYAMSALLSVASLVCTWSPTSPTSLSWRCSGMLSVPKGLEKCSVLQHLKRLCWIHLYDVSTSGKNHFCSFLHYFEASYHFNPQTVRSEEGQTAASLMVALLGLGLGSGAFLSNYFVMLI